MYKTKILQSFPAQTFWTRLFRDLKLNHLNGKGWTLSCDPGPGDQEETAPFTEFRADVSLNVSKHRARGDK